MRFLGIDYGLRKIGLAIGDDEIRISSPLYVIKNDRPIDVIKKIVHDEAIEALVVGIPEKTGDYHSDDQKRITDIFIKDLAILNIPIYKVGEQYTSVESQRLQEEGALAEEDALAAMLILQEYLDHLS
ncbi:RuvX/YqgF family protein [Patescibacteria group bacterium]|nr:RuvX/YqgF family protein [Patescibacteria group bacterium]